MSARKSRSRPWGWTPAAAWVLAVGCASTSSSTVLPADDEYRLGVVALERERWAEAAQHLNRFVLNYPEDERVIEGRFLLGRANFQSGEYPSAAQDFERFQQDFPADTLADDALYWAGRAYEAESLKPELDQGDTQRAISSYTELERQYPASSWLEETRGRASELRDRLALKEYLNARYYFRQKLWEATEIYVRSLIEQYPQSAYVAPAYLILVRAYEAQGREEDAQRIRETLLGQFPDSPEAGEVRRSLPPSAAASLPREAGAEAR